VANWTPAAVGSHYFPMFTQHRPVTAPCTTCGQLTLVQDYVVDLSDAGVRTTRLGTPRCTNPACVKADLVGWSHEAPRPQRG